LLRKERKEVWWVGKRPVEKMKREERKLWGPRKD
jgi:hypothetical protein